MTGFLSFLPVSGKSDRNLPKMPVVETGNWNTTPIGLGPLLYQSIGSRIGLTHSWFDIAAR